MKLKIGLRGLSCLIHGFQQQSCCYQTERLLNEMNFQSAMVIIGLIGLMLAFATLVLKIIEVARSK
jgi:hypothetical protein